MYATYFTHSDCPHRPGNVVGGVYYPFPTEAEAAAFASDFAGLRQGEREEAHVHTAMQAEAMGLHSCEAAPGDQGSGFQPHEQ